MLARILILLWILITPGLSSSTARAQSFLEITSTWPEEGAVSVPDAAVVTFTLSRPLPPFGSIFTRKFAWAPVRETRLLGLGHDFDDNGDLTIAFFDLEHRAHRDYSFWLYGIRSADGSRLERPFTLNYSTRPTRGNLEVSGSVVHRHGSGKRSDSASEWLRQSARELVAANRNAMESVVDLAGVNDNVDLSADASESSSENMYRRSVVLLLENSVGDGRNWHVHSAASLDDTGRFTLQDLREGVYWPVLITYATVDGEVISDVGFNDPSGTGMPASLTVDGNVYGVEITSSIPPPTHVSVAGHGDVHGPELTVFPNPTSSLLTIGVNGESSVLWSVQLFDMIGRQVYSTEARIEGGTKSLLIDVSAFTAGAYLLVVSGGYQRAQTIILVRR
jgi:hypothetical protein